MAQNNIFQRLPLGQPAITDIYDKLAALSTQKPASTTGFSGSVALAKLTNMGTNGSLTVVNGLITAYTAPT